MDLPELRVFDPFDTRLRFDLAQDVGDAKLLVPAAGRGRAGASPIAHEEHQPLGYGQP